LLCGLLPRRKELAKYSCTYDVKENKRIINHTACHFCGVSKKGKYNFPKKDEDRKQGKIERKKRKMSVVKVTVVLSCIVFLCCVLGQVHGFRRMNTGLPDLSNLNGKVAEAVKALELNSAETVRSYYFV